MNQVIAKELFHGFTVYDFDYFVSKMQAFSKCSDTTKWKPTMERQVAVAGRYFNLDVVCVYNKDFSESYIGRQVVSELRADFGDIELSQEDGPILRVKLEIQTQEESPKFFYPIIVKNTSDYYAKVSMRQTGKKDESIMAPGFSSNYFGMVIVIVCKRINQSAVCILFSPKQRYTRKGYVLEGKVTKEGQRCDRTGNNNS